MGFLPGHPPHPAAHADAAADAVFQRDDAAADRRAGARDAARCRRRSISSAVRRRRSASRRRSIRSPQHLKAALLVESAEARRDPRRAGVHAHQASRRSARRVIWASTGSRSSGFTATDRSRSGPKRWPDSRAAGIRVLVATDIAARGIDVTALGHVDQLRRAGRRRGLHPPRRPHGPRRTDRRRVHVGVAGRGGESSRDRAGDSDSRLPRVTVPDFDYQAEGAGASSGTCSPRPPVCAIEATATAQVRAACGGSA